ncbi:MAG: manganese efflux pump [Clostridia bacterium]|nr:manganese efflux pump [Clostridia bacterium]
MIYIIITALTVSIDSLICGFSLALSCKKKVAVIFGVALTVFAMCLFANYSTLFLQDKLNEKTVSIGGLILILVGLYNLLKKQNKTITVFNSPLACAITTGFAVGLDGALANLSLSLMGMNAFYVPLIIAVMHAITISVGVLLAQTRIAYKLAKIEFMPPLILIFLGSIKLLGLFI